MELVPALSRFYETIEKDSRINSTHISLYMALLRHCNINGGTNPFPIERSVIMRYAKINARYTYSKCINNLKDFGYVQYKPSTNAVNCSTIYLIEL